MRDQRLIAIDTIVIMIAEMTNSVICFFPLQITENIIASVTKTMKAAMTRDLKKRSFAK